jgi:hypothetical protein
MNIGEYLEFALFFGFLIIWIIFHAFSIFRPDRILKTQWAQSMWRKTTVKQLRLISGICLLAGLLFLVFSLNDLANGTFKWKGKPKTYGFSDFLK